MINYGEPIFARLHKLNEVTYVEHSEFILNIPKLIID